MLDEQIERSFGAGPELPPVEVRIAAGRRALRRRRVAAALTAAGVVAVVGTTYAVTVPGSDRHVDSGVAVAPSSTPTPTSRVVEPSAEPWKKNLFARYTADGTLEIRPGVVVHERIENPYGWAPPRYSDALDLTWKGRRLWATVELTRNGLAYGSSTPSNGWASFADWVADQSGSTTVNGGWPETLVLGKGGQVVAAAGAEVLQRTDDPRLGDGFAPSGTPTGAALVVVEGTSYFVVWRVVDGTLDTVVTPPGDVVGATFQELLTYARDQYASGGGLR